MSHWSSRILCQARFPKVSVTLEFAESLLSHARVHEASVTLVFMKPLSSQSSRSFRYISAYETYLTLEFTKSLLCQCPQNLCCAIVHRASVTLNSQIVCHVGFIVSLSRQSSRSLCLAKFQETSVMLDLTMTLSRYILWNLRHTRSGGASVTLDFAKPLLCQSSWNLRNTRVHGVSVMLDFKESLSRQSSWNHRHTSVHQACVTLVFTKPTSRQISRRLSRWTSRNLCHIYQSSRSLYHARFHRATDTLGFTGPLSCQYLQNLCHARVH